MAETEFSQMANLLCIHRNHEPVAIHTIFSDTLEVTIDVQQT